jgi:hypothetical protein
MEASNPFNKLQIKIPGASIKFNYKNWRGTRILQGDMTFSKKLPRVSDGLEF